MKHNKALHRIPHVVAIFAEQKCTPTSSTGELGVKHHKLKN
jgi:hypothetical protein